MKKLLIGFLIFAAPLWAAHAKASSNGYGQDDAHFHNTWSQISALLFENAETPYLDWPSAKKEKMAQLSLELKGISKLAFDILEDRLARQNRAPSAQKRKKVIKSLNEAIDAIFALPALKKQLEQTLSATFDFSKPRTDVDKNKFAEEEIWYAARERSVLVDKLLTLIKENRLPADEKLLAQLPGEYEDVQNNLAGLLHLIRMRNGEDSLKHAQGTLDLSTALVKKALELINSLLQTKGEQPKQAVAKKS